MGYATHVGRIGALAIALGVGGAIASPSVAQADEDGGSSPSAATSSAVTPGSAESSVGSTSSLSSHAPESTDPVPAATGTITSGDRVVGTESAAADSRDPVSVSAGDAPKVTISAQNNTSAPTAETSNDPDRAASAAAEPEVTATSAPHRTDAGHATAAALPATPDRPATHTSSAVTVETPAQPEPSRGEAPATSAPHPVARVAMVAVPSAPLPSVSVAVAAVTPSPASPPLQPVRNLVLGVLGIFGFTPSPAPGTINNPILEVLWGAYRRIESIIGNGAPAAGTPAVANTALTADGKVAVTLAMDFTDPDGDPLTYTTKNGAKGTLTANADGTYTYLTDAASVGTDSVAISATNTGFHLDSLFGGNHTRTATLAITLTPAANTPAVIDSVTSTPGTGNNWTVAVAAHDPEGAAVTTGLSAADPAHVTVTDAGDGTYAVSVTDDAWALAHPGAQITVTATASDGTTAPASSTLAIGTVANTVGAGRDFWGLTSAIPALPAGVTYTLAGAGLSHIVLVRSDGQVAVAGSDAGTDVPAPPDGLHYTQIASGTFHTALLRSDGTVVAVGDDSDGQTDVPALPDGVTYTGVAAGGYHTVLLRSDGQAVAFGSDDFGQTDIPALPTGVTYTGAAAGYSQTVLLRSDGSAVAIGKVYVEDPSLPLGGYLEDVDIPALPQGVTYTAVAAGQDFTVLQRSDGQAIGLGQLLRNFPLSTTPDGLTYTSITAAFRRAVLLRSDGATVTAPYVSAPDAELPALPTGVRYTSAAVGGDFTVFLTAVDSNRPSAASDSVTGIEDTPLVIAPNTLLDNDTDPKGHPLTVIGVSQGAHGSTVLGADGSITYTPVADYNGTDSFTYGVTNGSEDTVGTVTVTITPVNDAPRITTAPGTGNTWTVNIVDPDGDPISSAVTAADPTHVTITDNGHGAYTVTDTAWALAHPGAQITVTATASDGIAAPVSTTTAIGTVTNAIMVGSNRFGLSAIPALPGGLTYTSVAAGDREIVLLRSDGTVVSVGDSYRGTVVVPALPDGLTYTAIASGGRLSVLLRSDGTVIDTLTGQAGYPPLPAGLTYTGVATSGFQTVLLRSDGRAVGLQDTPTGLTEVALPDSDVPYTGVAAGFDDIVLLRADGTAVAVGFNPSNPTNIPEPPDGLTYTGVAAGGYTTALLLSDGTVIALGSNHNGQLAVPALPDGLTYTAVAPSGTFTAFLRSDGTVVVVGDDSEGQLDVPVLPDGVDYTEVAAGGYFTVLLTGVTATTV